MSKALAFPLGCMESSGEFKKQLLCLDFIPRDSQLIGLGFDWVRMGLKVRLMVNVSQLIWSITNNISGLHT